MKEALMMPTGLALPISIRHTTLATDAYTIQEECKRLHQQEDGSFKAMS